ncbi:SDR family NAD(P)-dependent oxidoreductase [Arthrobacter sp. B6]|uniref:SDR family NAD(P)-dependent oxidoreductase n=1 Tax=Arthrobacter sp. B6 TaxID=1570137 RepID=UPI0009EDB7AA|nr:SDR family oxidoreductase [Arthrobacter sp. B6]
MTTSWADLVRPPVDMTGDRVLVLGATGGIGRATVAACLGANAHVTLLDLRDPEEDVRQLRALVGEDRVAGAALDNGDKAQVARMIDELGPFTAVADCSGIYVDGDLLNDDPDSWETNFDRIMRINVLGPLNVLRAVLPEMQRCGRGRVALIGSLGARNGGSNAAVNPAYVASKGAVQSLVRSLSRSMAPHGIVVNAVAPGMIETPMMAAASHTGATQRPTIPLGRTGAPEDIGRPMAFLCSPAASFMTGMILDVNGGLYA